MANETGVPDDEGTAEIVSSLKSEVEETPGRLGEKLVKTIVERRGIRKSTRRVYEDPLDNLAQDIFSDKPLDTYALLFEAANRHLKAKGLMHFFDVVELAEREVGHVLNPITSISPPVAR